MLIGTRRPGGVTLLQAIYTAAGAELSVAASDALLFLLNQTVRQSISSDLTVSFVSKFYLIRRN